MSSYGVLTWAWKNFTFRGRGVVKLYARKTKEIWRARGKVPVVLSEKLPK